MRARDRARKTALKSRLPADLKIKLQSCSGKQEETTFQQTLRNHRLKTKAFSLTYFGKFCLVQRKVVISSISQLIETKCTIKKRQLRNLSIVALLPSHRLFWMETRPIVIISRKKSPIVAKCESDENGRFSDQLGLAKLHEI